MYAAELDASIIPFDSIYLDPNNPRFWGEKTVRDTPDLRVPDIKVQERTMEAIKKYGVEDLRVNIMRNGFLPMDRIVIRPLAGHEDKYVVVEGNRRTAALRLLRQQIDEQYIAEEGIDDDYLERLKASTDAIEVLVYRGSDTHDISWLLQGIRHISGIRDWLPAQQARLVADRIDNHGYSVTAASQQFGINSQKVARLYRTLKALQQMASDEEFQSKADNRYFSLFEEAIRDNYVREWLGWSKAENRFENIDHLRQFYSWIVPDQEAPPDVGNNRRIHDPRHIKILSKILASKNHNVLAKINQWEMPIEKAEHVLSDVPAAYDWREALDQAMSLIGAIPQGAIKAEAEQYIVCLDKLLASVTTSKAMAMAALESGGI